MWLLVTVGILQVSAVVDHCSWNLLPGRLLCAVCAVLLSMVELLVCTVTTIFSCSD